jgi:hypothetical protein
VGEARVSVGTHMNQPHGQERRRRIEKIGKRNIWGRREYEKTGKKRKKKKREKGNLAKYYVTII